MARLPFTGAATAVALALLAGCANLPNRGDTAGIYKRYSDYMTLSGRFRSETAPADAPYTGDDLVRDFENVVFVPEAQLERFYKDGAASRRLSKWTGPIRYRLMGDGVRPADRATFKDLSATLSLGSGLSIQELPASEPEAAANLLVFVVTPRARGAIGSVETGHTWYDVSILKDWIETLNPPCFALFDAGVAEGGAIRNAAIFVKAELEDPLRGACFVEEFTQSLGLVFDHDDVRPSIFNDDQEFIALTNHDLELLEILYDPSFTPGMTRDQAAPILRRIVARRSAGG